MTTPSPPDSFTFTATATGDRADEKSWSHVRIYQATETGNRGEGRSMAGAEAPWCRWLAADGTDEDQPDGMIAAEAVRLRQEAREQPFFIGVGFHKPHDPFISPKKYFDLYPLGSLPLAVDPPDRSPDLASKEVLQMPADELCVHGARLRRTDVRAVAQETRVEYRGSSCQPAASGTPARRGGARAERAFARLTALFANALSRQASGERMLCDQRVFNDAAADEMLLDNPLEDRRIALAIPRTLGIDDGDRSAFTDAQAVHFRAQNPALL